MAKQATQNPKAYKLYLTGEFYFAKEGLENERKAVDYFNQAIALDPNFALAYAGAADAYRLLAVYGELDPREATAKGKTAATRALALDDTLADAHVALAGFEHDDWEWSSAETEFKRAIALNANLAVAHHRYSQCLTRLRRFSEAYAENKRAQELDPLRTRFKIEEGNILYFERRYDEAIQQLENAVRLEPESDIGHVFLGYAYSGKGRYADAINEYQRFISLEDDNTSVDCFLGYAYAMAGKRDEVLAILNKLKTTKKYLSFAELAILYAGFGDKEAAFQSLERAYAAHDLQMQFLTTDPAYDALRSDPRFADLVRRVGLPQ